MISRTCDRCGEPLEDGALRYVARIEVFAGYDPLEITGEDLTRDHKREIHALLQQCAGMTEEELMQDVYVKLEFDLCRKCQRAFLKNPLGAPEDG